VPIHFLRGSLKSWNISHSALFELGLAVDATQENSMFIDCFCVRSLEIIERFFNHLRNRAFPRVLFIQDYPWKILLHQKSTEKNKETFRVGELGPTQLLGKGLKDYLQMQLGNVVYGPTFFQR